MPVPLLIALVLAFGFDAIGETGPLPPGAVAHRAGLVGLGVLFVAAASFLTGRVLAAIVRRRPEPSTAVRLAHQVAVVVVDALGLMMYAWAIHFVGWAHAVNTGLGLRNAILADEMLILAPFLLAQLAAWWGLYASERALRSLRAKSGVPGSGRYLLLKARQSLGIVLPVALAYALGRDVVQRFWPWALREPWFEVAGTAAMGALVLVLSPAFARLSWPTRPLEPGPLRERLERLSWRAGFRCTDILVQDTGGGVINAGVTGALPWFRYVLLTDALVEYLNEREVEAVFGHEVGHIAHRHLAYFGLLIVGSMGVLALVAHCIELLVPTPPSPLRESILVSVLKGVAALTAVGAYFLGLFGFVSRRFERQADVYGCRAISCGRDECPPHADLNAHPTALPMSAELCPVGIRTFADVLSRVERLNGHKETFLTFLLAWRHGRVSGRVAFLNGLEAHPDAERRFQVGVGRLRLTVAALLAAAMLAAVVTDSLRHLAG